MLMKWTYDSVTEEAARAVPIINCSEYAPQATPKWNISEEIWRERLRLCDKPATELWKEFPAIICPDTIIKQFAKKHYLQGLILVTRWGNMDRKLNDIYRKEPSEKISDKTLDNIHNALAFCAKNLKDTCQIDESWQQLTGREKEQLAWKPVMASKTLHFLSRAVGFEQNPPVAIDNEAILKKAWPAWKDLISNRNDITCPKNWRGTEGYFRYMTAICVWANEMGWKTTDVETTIFAKCYK